MEIKTNLTHKVDSTGHVISILHDGRSCNIETTYQPILAVTDPRIGMGRDLSKFQIGKSPKRFGVHSNLGTNNIDTLVLYIT